MFLIITKKIWDKENFSDLDKRRFKISNEINSKKISKTNPKIIFFIHWSKKISENLFKKNLCIQFHSSDLPKFRGGSPIQNQILRKVFKTKISAFKINNFIDAGDICLKKDFYLQGNAENIYKNMEKKCVQMIKIISKKKKLKFYKQVGKKSFFRRRKSEQSDLTKNNFKNYSSLFDFIRMLDAEDYPKAFINIGKFRIKLSNASLNKKNITGKFKIDFKRFYK